MPDLWMLLAVPLGALLLVFVVPKLHVSVLTLRAMSIAPRLSRGLSRWVKSNAYDESGFYGADGAGADAIARRRRALDRLAGFFATRYHRSIAWADAVREGFSDIRFTDVSRVPFPFMPVMRDKFNVATVVTASDGPRLRDLDGQWTLDVSGSYGVNVAGFDRYKEWIDKGWARVRDLGAVLGPLHPIVADNIEMLRRISRLDEVSFHMSGTEAVMAAVRLARFNTRRKLIVCFAGAYHGWWDGVLAGLGSERNIDDCLTLKDLDPASLKVIRRRAHEIAGVLVNPIQSFHPNSPPPNDAVLLTSAVRNTGDSSGEYGRWLRRLREVCTACGIPLIFDEVYTGFRLAVGGAQETFGTQADLVAYGKTVAGGLPIGVVCGKRSLMRRFDPAHPMRLAYVVGTFSAHPAVMGAMYEFLRWALDPATPASYGRMNAECDAWVRSTNERAIADVLPIRVVSLGTIWTVLFKEPGRYNWLLQYYLRAEGVTLSWVGTGRCLVSMDFTAADYQRLQASLLRAAHQMKQDGWWLSADEHPDREKHMRVRLFKEMLGSLVQVPQPLKSFYTEVMRRKDDDHHASHNDKANQLLHLVSSSVFIYCYFIIFSDLTTAMCLGLASLFVRQFGHAVLEPVCHDEEETLLGYNTRNKTLIVLGYTAIPILQMLNANAWSFGGFVALLPTIARQWFLWTVLVVAGRVLYLIWKYNFRLSMVWYFKLVTDPLTDVITYFPWRPQRA
jgi:glutamate-1-semialdehyde 2,1-aminomutase